MKKKTKSGHEHYKNLSEDEKRLVECRIKLYITLKKQLQGRSKMFHVSALRVVGIVEMQRS